MITNYIKKSAARQLLLCSPCKEMSAFYTFTDYVEKVTTEHDDGKPPLVSSAYGVRNSDSDSLTPLTPRQGNYEFHWKGEDYVGEFKLQIESSNGVSSLS